jgi:hypothetical protein
MKQVHDVLQVFLDNGPHTPLEPFIRPTNKERGVPIPFAIIQWGNPEEGYEYEIICPFCAKSVGWHAPEGEDTFGTLAIAGGGFMALHHKDCSRFGESRPEVEITKGPLGTSQKPRQM